MKKIFTYLAVILLFFSSCDKYIDIQPKGLIIPTSEKDLKILLEDSEIAYTGVEHSMYSDELTLPQRDRDLIEQDDTEAELSFSFKLDDNIYTDLSNDANWEGYYRNISKCNYVLEQLKTVTIINQDVANEVKGEALFHRAFAYFMLVNIYGHHYGLEVAKQADSGVPIVAKFADTEASLKRASVHKVYEVILEDIKEAAKLLSINKEYNYLPNKAGAYTLLAKTYAHMGEYSKAKDAIDEAFKYVPSEVMLMDYNYDLYDDGDGYSYLEYDWMYNTEIVVCKYSPCLCILNDFGDDIYIQYYSDKLINSFDKDNDLRYKSMTVEQEIDGKTYINYSGCFDDASAITGITLPEMHLLKAELLVRNNLVTEGMDELNILRANRFDENADESIIKLSATDKEDALNKIFEERMKELAFSGKRFIDIKRLNALDNKNISLSRTIEGETRTWNANSKNWALTIAPKYIRMNPEIVQNERE